MKATSLPGQDKPVPQPSTTPSHKTPNEVGAMSVEGFVKIFDPNSKTVYLETRA